MPSSGGDQEIYLHFEETFFKGCIIKDKLLFTVLRDLTNNLTITILYYTLKLSGMHCAELICEPKKSYRNIIIFYYILYFY